MDCDLLVSDLDGTLLDGSVELDPALVAAFGRAAGRGLRITIATGRMPAAVDHYARALGVDAPIIFYNGALVRDPATGRDLLSLALPAGILGRAYGTFAHAPVDPLFYRDDRLYCLGLSPSVREYCDDEGLRATVIPDAREFLGQDAFVKGLFIGHPAALAVLRQELEAVVGDEARLVRTQTNYLELIPVGASKGAALVELARHLGIPLERVIAIGDQENDIEMIRAARLGVAMPRAPAAVIAAADRVAPAPAEGGLLALLAELLPRYFTE